jgi:hypothetical protein
MPIGELQTLVAFLDDELKWTGWCAPQINQAGEVGAPACPVISTLQRRLGLRSIPPDGTLKERSRPAQWERE